MERGRGHIVCVQQQRQNKRTGARADKDGLPTPFDNHAVARLERGDVDLEGGEGEDVGRRVHRREELDDEQPRGGRFSLGNPKSDVEWMIYWAERLPGPGEYKIRDTRMIGVDVWGGKFNESRPESDVERKMRIGRCTPGPGEHNVDSGPKMEYQETLNKARALLKAIHVAESQLTES